MVTETAHSGFGSRWLIDRRCADHLRELLRQFLFQFKDGLEKVAHLFDSLQGRRGVEQKKVCVIVFAGAFDFVPGERH